MDEKRRFFVLLIIMTVVAIGVAGMMLFALYMTSYEEQRERLVETAKSAVRLIEAVARFNEVYSPRNFPGGSFAATISQIQDAHSHFRGFGETGEFTLAKKEGDQIVFLLRHRHDDLDNLRPVPLASNLAEPMRCALSGKSGTLVGLDYRGETVLAAYEPIEVLNLGIVVKIDLAEIRAPFVRAGLVAGGSGLALILLGTGLFLRIGSPMVRRLQESEEKYRNLFEHANDSIFITDPSNGHLLDLNEIAAQRLGYSREELLQLNMADIDAPMAARYNDEIMRKLLDTRSIVFEHAHIRKDGVEIPVEISGRVIEYGGKKVIQSIVRDITDRKRAENALRESEARYRRLSESLDKEVKNKMNELREAESLAAIGRMVSVVAHEVRNPLQNIQMGVEAISRAMGDDRDKTEMLEEINYGVEVLNEIVVELLEYSKPLKLQYYDWKIGDIVEQTLKTVSHKLDNVSVHLELDPEEKEISVDIVKLTSALANLISNAVEAMPGGGALRICSRLSEINGSSALMLQISDTGCGITKENLEKIHEAFFTTKTRGIGLGIPASKKIIEAHEGTLNFISEVGKGTTAEIILPIQTPK